jgi:hypothetical protein
MNRVFAIALSVASVPAVVAVGATPASMPTTKPVAAPAPYTPVRWNEDYSYLKDPAKKKDFFDPIKYIPLNDEGDWYLSLGGQARYRYELFDSTNFGVGPQDDDGFNLGRFMGHADLHAGPYFRGFIQVISAVEGGRNPEPRPQDADDLDIHQGFIDVNLPLGLAKPVTFRGGRQNLIYGAQRLISPLDWTNVRRTFDGVKVATDPSKGNHVEAFWVHPVVVDKDDANSGNDDVVFTGVYDVQDLQAVFGKPAGTKLDAYAFYNDNNGGQPLLGETYTVGARFSSKPKPFDLDVEADYQFGNAPADGDISAWSFAAVGGYTFPVSTSPRIYVGGDVASGDDDPTDADRQTFNQLYPLGHAYFGYVDVIGRQNIIDLHPGAELTILEKTKWARKLTASAEYHLFWRESDADAVYNAAGGVLRADGGSDETYVGSEIDLLVNWQIDRHTLAYFGYSHLFAGDFLEDTGPSEDIDFVYAALQYTF